MGSFSSEKRAIVCSETISIEKQATQETAQCVHNKASESSTISCFGNDADKVTAINGALREHLGFEFDGIIKHSDFEANYLLDLFKFAIKNGMVDEVENIFNHKTNTLNALLNKITQTISEIVERNLISDELLIENATEALKQDGIFFDKEDLIKNYKSIQFEPYDFGFMRVDDLNLYELELNQYNFDPSLDVQETECFSDKYYLFACCDNINNIHIEIKTEHQKLKNEIYQFLGENKCDLGLKDIDDLVETSPDYPLIEDYMDTVGMTTLEEFWTAFEESELIDVFGLRDEPKEEARSEFMTIAKLIVARNSVNKAKKAKSVKALLRN